jgi:hypothetical protein
MGLGSVLMQQQKLREARGFAAVNATLEGLRFRWGFRWRMEVFSVLTEMFRFLKLSITARSSALIWQWLHGRLADILSF